MDLSQILLIAIILILTLILTILGVQVFFILKDVRKITSTTNKVLTDVKSGTNVAKILGAILTVFGGRKTASLVNLMTKEEKPQRIYSEDQKQKKPLRRFFRRS